MVEGWLRLPAAAGLTLVFAALRKEAAVRDWLTPAQVLTYALVNTLTLPCLATVGLLARTIGRARAGAVVLLTLLVALLLGRAAARVPAGL